MKFTKEHKRGRRTYRVGDRFEGAIKTARFLYHRGILTPDGAPEDALVTGPKVTSQVWDAFDATAEKE